MSNELFELVERLKSETKILVSGPCRSGTTVMSHILVDMLGLKFVDSYENDQSDTDSYVHTFDAFLHLVENEDIENFIAHGPHFHPFLHRVPRDVCIVFMRRNFGDIFASTKRIYCGKWTDEFYSKNMESIVENKHREFFKKLSYPGKVYFVWDKYQKNRVSNFVEAKYEWIGSHRFYIQDSKRTKFKERQWK